MSAGESSEDCSLGSVTPNSQLPSSAEPSYIQLIVGAEQVSFEIVEELICNRCPFFYNAFAGNFLEAQTKRITFPDDEPERFGELQAWLQEDSIPDSGYSWLSLSKIWLFAEKYHIDELQNTVVDALYAKYAAHDNGIHIAFETLDYVAEHTFARSLLRQLFSDMLTNGISLDQLPSRLENIPYEFMQDMCLAYASRAARNGPANVSLLSTPIASYYSSSAACKATAVPKVINPADVPTEIYCEGDACQRMENPEPIRNLLHICTNHNVKLCHNCRHSHHGHRKKMMSLMTVPYRDTVTGGMTIIDAQMNDSGFYCDGPKCDTRLHDLGLPHWALMSGDRYHCLECPNVDFCSICVRGELTCKDEGHAMLRIRPTFARTTFMTERVPIKERQRRLESGLCLRCASGEHGTESCEAKDPVLVADVAVEE